MKVGWYSSFVIRLEELAQAFVLKGSDHLRK